MQLLEEFATHQRGLFSGRDRSRSSDRRRVPTGGIAKARRWVEKFDVRSAAALRHYARYCFAKRFEVSAWQHRSNDARHVRGGRLHVGVDLR